ncbi:MAG: hypothetical protein Q8M19_19340 [Reyranella sp.]|nr:hypothetical protein [Reyranella sp.]
MSEAPGHQSARHGNADGDGARLLAEYAFEGSKRDGTVDGIEISCPLSIEFKDAPG